MMRKKKTKNQKSRAILPTGNTIVPKKGHGKGKGKGKAAAIAPIQSSQPSLPASASYNCSSVGGGGGDGGGGGGGEAGPAEPPLSPPPPMKFMCDLCGDPDDEEDQLPFEMGLALGCGTHYPAGI